MSARETDAVTGIREPFSGTGDKAGNQADQAAWYISPALRQQLIEALSGAPLESGGRKMTYEEFLAWADEDILAEWVSGEAFMTSPASDRHQNLMSFLDSLLRLYVEENELGIVRTAPFQVKLEHGREPDLLFLSNAHLDRLKDNRVDGPPDLIVEIVSPESVAGDRGEKFEEYARGGVSEYWLIDPQVRWAAIYHLDEAGRYQPGFTGSEGIFQSRVLPGFWARAEWLWQPPRVVQVLRELHVI
jgi:Uma2 family endonuclease